MTHHGGMNMSKAATRDPWIDKNRLYNRKKSEVEHLIDGAEAEMKVQHIRYLERKEHGSQRDTMRALLKYTRAKAVYDTVRWVAVERGASHPMAGNFANHSTPNNR